MLRAAIGLVVGLTAIPAYAQIFKCTDAVGKVEYRNSACPAGTQSMAVDTREEPGPRIQIQRSEDASANRRDEAGKEDATDARASARPLRRSAPVNALPPPPQK